MCLPAGPTSTKEKRLQGKQEQRKQAGGWGEKAGKRNPNRNDRFCSPSLTLFFICNFVNQLSLPKLPLAAGATVSTIEENDSTVQKDTAESESKETEETGTTATEDQQAFWRVSDMMAFENIGFSKKLPNGIQFLSCADCDTGPLGYHDSTGPNKEYLIALNRIRYHERS